MYLAMNLLKEQLRLAIGGIGQGEAAQSLPPQIERKTQTGAAGHIALDCAFYVLQ